GWGTTPPTRGHTVTDYRTYVIDGGEYVLAAEPAPCWPGDQTTSYTDICFEAHLHPGPCTKAKNHQFFLACNMGVSRTTVMAMPMLARLVARDAQLVPPHP